MEHYIDLTEIDKKYKDKCSLIKAGKCKNVNIFLKNSRELNQLKQIIREIKEMAMSAPAIDSELSLRILEKCEVINEK